MTLSSISVDRALSLHPAWLGLAGLGTALFFHFLGRELWRGLWRGQAQQGRSDLAAEPLLRLFFQQILGMGAAAMALLLLALAGVFQAAVIAAAALLGAVLACLAPRWWPADKQRAGVAGTPSGGAAAQSVALWELVVLGCAAVSAAAVSWHFPAAWDDTAYHLPLARTIVDHQALIANEWLRFPYFPAFMQLLFAAGLLVDVSFAQWLATWPMVVVLLGLMGLARRLCGHSAWGVLAWVLYVSTPAARHALGAAYVDAGLTAFSLAAMAAVAAWAQSPRVPAEANRWLALAGLCAGLAAGSKFHGLVMAGIIGMALTGLSLWRGRPADTLRHMLVYGAAVLGVCGFWYARSWWVTGDPLHPAGGAWFGYYLWTAQDMGLQLAEQASHGVPKQWRHFLAALWQVKAPYLLVALAWPVLLGWRGAHGWLMLGLVFSAGVLFWFLVSQVDRYLLPVLPAGALLFTAVLERVWSAARSRAGKAIGRLWSLLPSVLATWLMLGIAGHCVSELLTRPSPAEQRAAHDELALLRLAEELAPQYGDRVLNLGYENAFFYYRGQLIGDWFGVAAFPRVADCEKICRLRSPGETTQAMRRLGVRLLLVHAEKFPFDLQQYTASLTLVAHRGSAFLFVLP